MDGLSAKDIREQLQTAELTQNFILRNLDKTDKDYLQVPNTRLALHSSR